MHTIDETLVGRVNPLLDPRWDAKVAELSGATFFHTAAWARVLCDTYRYQPCYFIERCHDGSLGTLVPLLEVNSWLTGRRGVSLPFTDECAPLGHTENGFPRVLRAISAFGETRSWKYWEIRGGLTALGAPASVAYHGHALELPSDPAQVFDRCDSAVRRAVRKAEQSRLTVTFTHDLDSMRRFHELLCKTRRRHGVPPQPLRFFANIQRHVLARGHGCIVLAHCDEKPAAGAVFFHFGRSALFKFGASDEAFQHLRPNNLVMWRAIEWFARAGFASLDFGRTSLDNEGLRRFKLGWGATERRVEYARFDRRAAAFVSAPDPSSGWHNGIVRMLPHALARMLGAAAYKHIA